jgi:hypothetical protein
VPPRGVSGTLAPAQIEVRVLSSGEFQVDPVGTVLKATPFPQPGERGGPTLAVTLRNITGTPLRISVRLQKIAPELDAVATLRGSAGGAVLLRGSLADTAEWTEPLGLVRSGQSTTLRIRFKLRKGLDPDQFAGRLDIRQLEIKGTAPGKQLEVPSDGQQVVPGTVGTSPLITPAPTSPGGVAATPAPKSTPVPSSAIPPRSDDAPKRRAPDEGTE